MGIYVGNVKIDIAGIDKVYVGNTLVYQKQAGIPYTIQWATGAPVNCTVNPSLPYTSQGGDTELTINLPYADGGSQLYMRYKKSYVGTTNGGNDIINYDFSNHTFGPSGGSTGTITEAHHIPLTIPGSVNGETLYCDFEFVKQTISPTKSICVELTSTATVTLNISFADLGIQEDTIIYFGNTSRPRSCGIVCLLGKGDTEQDAWTDMVASEIAEFKAISPGSTNVTVCTISNPILARTGRVTGSFNFRTVKGNAILGSSFQFIGRATNNFLGKYWLFILELIIL